MNRVTPMSAPTSTLGGVTHPLARIASTATVLALLNGCAGLGGQDFAEGWRSALVVELGRAGELASKTNYDCAVGAAPNAPYLVVRYRDHGVQTQSLGTANFPPNTDFRAGEAVQVNVKDCEVRPS
jgi:hypothetical protein